MPLRNRFLGFLIAILCLKIGECACPVGYDTFLLDCYRIYDDMNVTFADAQTQCEDDGTHLLYIRDCNQFSTILKYAKTSRLKDMGTGLWVGASDGEEEGDWIWGNGYPVSMGVPFWGTTGNSWDPEPNGRQNENCAQLSTADQYFLHDENCEEATGSPFCHIENDITENDSEYDSMIRKLSNERDNYEAVTCPDNFTYIGQSCFFFGNELKKVPMEEASSYCQNIGAQLPILKDCIEFQELVEEIGKNYPLDPGESYWTSANDNAREGNWIWGDYTNANPYPPFWGSVNGVPEPSGATYQNCGILYRDDRYYFHDGQCGVGSIILCQTNADVTINRKEP